MQIQNVYGDVDGEAGTVTVTVQTDDPSQLARKLRQAIPGIEYCGMWQVEPGACIFRTENIERVREQLYDADDAVLTMLSDQLYVAIS